MRKLAEIIICPLLIVVLNGCSADAPAPPSASTPTLAKAADARPPAGKGAKKMKTPRRPKLEAVTKREVAIKPFSD